MSGFHQRLLTNARESRNHVRMTVELLEDRRLLYAVGPEFQVNTYTQDDQGDTSAAMDADGNFVVVWTSGVDLNEDPLDGQDGNGAGIFAQRYNAAGVAQGSEFQVNTHTTNYQNTGLAHGTVAMDGDGDFVVVWESYTQDGSGDGVYAQRFDSAGVKQGGELQVNTTTFQQQDTPKVAMDDDGGFVVVWESADADFEGVYAQRFNASGVPQGGEFQVNTSTTFLQQGPSVAMDADGDFVVAWESYHDGGAEVYAQRYNAAGVAQGSEFRVNSYTTGRQISPSVAMDADGDFVVAWQGFGQGNEYGIFAQRFNAAGVAQGEEFQVNTYTTNIQFLPSVAVDEDGDFVVSWTSYGQDAPEVGAFARGIFAQQFNAAGDKVGPEFQVNTYTTGPQAFSSVAIDADGDFVIAWGSDDDQDGEEYGVYAQRFTPAEVVGRHIFYNDSKFDDNTPDVHPADDSAIATDKSAYLPGGGLFAPANVTSYSKGINGVMIDVRNLKGAITASDFTFKVGTNNTPSTWATAPAPTTVSVRTGAGVGGTDRIEIIWANNDIENEYLEVIVEGNDTAGGDNTNTGLPASDIFFFGNKVGDDFLATPPATFTTSAADEINARNNPGFLQPITNIYDHNKDTLVSAGDAIIARNNTGFIFKLNISNPPAAPVELGDDGAASAIASALAIPGLPDSTEDGSLALPLPVRSAPPDAVADGGEHSGAAARLVAFDVVATDEIVAELDTDDELLELLLADLHFSDP